MIKDVAAALHISQKRGYRPLSRCYRLGSLHATVTYFLFLLVKVVSVTLVVLPLSLSLPCSPPVVGSSALEGDAGLRYPLRVCMASPVSLAARSLATDYRTQASQIQSLIDANGSITNLGIVDPLNFRMPFPTALLPQHDRVQRALCDARNSLSALADVFDRWAADIDLIISDTLAASTRETRNTRRAQPY